MKARVGSDIELEGTPEEISEYFSRYYQKRPRSGAYRDGGFGSKGTYKGDEDE